MRACELWGNSGKSGEFWRILGKFRGILEKFKGNSGEVWGNSGEFWRILGKSDQKLFITFHSFSFVFQGEKYISLLGKSNSLDFSSGYCENWWKFRGKKVKGNSQGNVNPLTLLFRFPFPPISFNCTVLYTGLLSQKALPAYLKSKQLLPFDFAPQIYISHCQPFKFNISFLARLLIFN